MRSVRVGVAAWVESRSGQFAAYLNKLVSGRESGVMVMEVCPPSTRRSVMCCAGQ